jgi:hypothetical protein
MTTTWHGLDKPLTPWFRGWQRPWWTLALLLGIAGCAFGRSYENIEAIRPEGPAKKLLVSDFVEGRHQVSATESSTILNINESIAARDSSAEVASALRSKGIAARAKKGAKVGDLASDELLLEGSIVNSEIGNPSGWGIVMGVVVSSITIFVEGGILPYFWPPQGSCEWQYNIQITDHDGNIVLSRRASWHSYESYPWAWSFRDRCSNSGYQNEEAAALRAKIADSIAGGLGGV